MYTRPEIYGRDVAWEKHEKKNKVYYRLMYSAFPISKSVRALPLPHIGTKQTFGYKNTPKYSTFFILYQAS